MNKQEKNEIKVLLDQGYQFRIRHKDTPRKGILALFRKNKTPQDTETVLDFREPTLAVLDLVTERFLNLKINEPAPDGDPIRSATQTVADNAEKMAEILAIFALGEDCFTKTHNGYKFEGKKVETLAKTIFHNVTPGTLYKLISVTTAMANLANFLQSIRLTGASRTTAPTTNLVE